MRLLYLIGDVDLSSVRPIIEELDDLASPEPVCLKICSGGGDVSAAFALIASMQNAYAPVHTFGFGEVASAALDILACGKRRALHPLTIGMSHGVSTAGQGQRCADLEDLRAAKLYTGNRMVLDNWSKLFGKRKRWHTAQELINYGFADEISEVPILVTATP